MIFLCICKLLDFRNYGFIISRTFWKLQDILQIGNCISQDLGNGCLSVKRIQANTILYIITILLAIIYFVEEPRSSRDLSFCKSRSDALYAAPSSCKQFVQCHQGRTTYKNCSPGTLFNPAIKVCDWPRNVKCGIVKPKVKIVPSKPRSLSLTAINATTVKIRWSKPQKYTKPLLTYVINIIKSGYQSSIQFTLSATARSHIQVGLVPGSKYIVQIHAVNKVGAGPKVIGTVITPFETPPAPLSLSAKVLDSTAITLQWKDSTLVNDSILKYVITYGLAGLQIGRQSLHLHGYSNTALLTNLLPGKVYSIKVQAVTFGGFGKPSIIKVFTSSKEFCPAGHYSNSGKKPCHKCVFGRYQDKIGRKDCKPCPRGSITLIRGASSFKDCQKVISS